MNSKHFEFMKIGQTEGMARRWVYDMATILAKRPKSRIANDSLLADCDFASVVWC